MVSLFTQNQKIAVPGPPTTSENSAESDLFSQNNSENLIPHNVGPAISGQLAEVGKWYCLEESGKLPVVAKIAERLETSSNCDFAKVSKLNEEIDHDKKILPQKGRQRTCRNSETNKSVQL